MNPISIFYPLTKLFLKELFIHSHTFNMQRRKQVAANVILPLDAKPEFS